MTTTATGTDNEVTGGGAEAAPEAAAAAAAVSENTSGSGGDGGNSQNEGSADSANASGQGAADNANEGSQGAGEGEGDQSAGGPPESYDLKLEGELADAGVREGLEGSFREAGMTQEGAEKFVGKFMPKLLEHQKAKAEQWKTDLAETLKSDPEFIGKDGKGYDASVELRDTAIKAVPGGDRLHTYLTESGLINMPGLANAFRWFGEQMKEDSVLTGGSGKGNLAPQNANGDIDMSAAGKALYGKP